MDDAALARAEHRSWHVRPYAERARVTTRKESKMESRAQELARISKTIHQELDTVYQELDAINTRMGELHLTAIAETTRVLSALHWYERRI